MKPARCRHERECISRIALVTTDHNQRLEKPAKSARCGHLNIANVAFRRENQGESACYKNRGVGGQPKSAKTFEKTQLAMVKTPSNELKNRPNESQNFANAS